MIAISLMCEPDLIIADEPTTALDVTTQSEILNIFNDLKKNLNIGLVLISHNIGVIAETSNEVLVMKDGQILESGDTIKVLTKPQNEYTKHLLSCIPPWIGN
jgi:ABC-type dipeptide/oligopeptide/nickel transport system ATPase component